MTTTDFRTPTNYTQIESARSDDAVLLETLNHFITLWYMAHPACRDEIKRYKAACRELDALAGIDDEAATVLAIVNAKDEFRSLYGHEWQGN